ncbi:autotransporter assembly complex protein TamA [Phenylobacterium montanum]|uniref:autotransporter assembly complex protein TamA n=1 Tax=Phenylobacterium montanum TaxID=2823693 RepID=UPI0020116DD1|nr:autotransporter assembly complex family protein [Caulobacter sp. S6]
MRIVGGALGAGLGLVAVLAVVPAEAAPKFDVRGVEDRSLRNLIQEAIGSAAAPTTTRLEARRRATEAGERAIAVLRSEGYYDYEVTPDIGEGDTPQPFIRVTQGPRSKIANPHIEWIDAPPAAEVQAAAEKAMALSPGAPGRAEDVIAAEGRIVATLQKSGYADADARPRQVIVDHADQTVQPAYRIAAGGLVRMDGVELKGASRTRLAWIRSLAPWKAGQVYRPRDVAVLERRLTDTGAYDSVTVALAPSADAKDGRRPVVVSLADRPKGTLELGASYSTTEGAGVDSRWIVYNRLGFADTLTTSLVVAQLDSRAQVELALPDWRQPERTLKLTAALYRDDTTAYLSQGAVISADLTRKYSKISFLTYGLSVDGSETDEKEAANLVTLNRRRNLATLAGLVAFNLDKSNDPLNPTAGWRISASAQPTYAVGDGPVAFLKAWVQGSAYLPLGGDNTVIASRAKIGSIFGGNIPLVPAPSRFYAGGGGSVRGYAYQAVGPRYPDNTPEGGLSIVEASVELRQHIKGPWGVAAFIDAGAAGKQVNPDFTHPDIGIGLGLRYNLGFGPIRVDIGTPLVRRNGDSPVQLYLSIGQSF